jgi:hypothetical protein
MWVGIDGGALWCVQAHKMMMLISTYIVNKGETLYVLMDVGVALLLPTFLLRFTSELLLLPPLLWYLVSASMGAFALLCRSSVCQSCSRSSAPGAGCAAAFSVF